MVSRWIGILPSGEIRQGEESVAIGEENEGAVNWVGLMDSLWKKVLKFC